MRIAKYIFYDILRTRFILFYTLFLFISTFALYQLDNDTNKVIMSLMNIVLLVMPLVSIVFTTIHFFNSYEFMELMLSQPVNRRVIFMSEFFSLSLSLGIAYLIGVGVPVLIYGLSAGSATLLVAGFLLTIVFVSLAFLASVLVRDKAKAIGLSLLFWFYFSLIYDGLLLWIVYAFSDYPIEKVTLCLILLNPVDLARIMMLLTLDSSALMGYTGAFFQTFIGSNSGIIFSYGALIIWIILPALVALKVFAKKDL